MDSIDELNRPVPDGVCHALREIEAGGAVDMYDREHIIRITAYGQSDAAPWLAANRHLYFRALRCARETEARRELLAAA